eukprot:Awhi_evm1s2075
MSCPFVDKVRSAIWHFKLGNLTTIDINSDEHEFDDLWTGDEGVIELATFLKKNDDLFFNSLLLSNDQIGDFGISILATTLKEKNFALCILDLSNNSIGDLGAFEIASFLKQSVSLRTLDLSNNVVRGDGAVAIFSAIESNQSLTTFDFLNNSISDVGSIAAASALLQNKFLTSLDLSGNDIVDVGQLTHSLHENDSLTILDLSYNKIGIIGARNIAAVMKVNHTLKTLHLSGIQMGVDGAIEIANALKENRSITTLLIDNNQIENKGGKAIANALRENDALETLYLQTNRMDDNGVWDMSNAMQENCCLTTLYLDCKRLGPVGVKHISLGLMGNSSLISLCLFDIPVREHWFRDGTKELEDGSIAKVPLLELEDALTKNVCLLELEPFISYEICYIIKRKKERIAAMYFQKEIGLSGLYKLLKCHDCMTIFHDESTSLLYRIIKEWKDINVVDHSIPIPRNESDIDFVLEKATKKLKLKYISVIVRTFISLNPEHSLSSNANSKYTIETQLISKIASLISIDVLYHSYYSVLHPTILIKNDNSLRSSKTEY